MVAFNFDHWRQWLAARANDLDTTGVPATFRINDEHLASSAVEIDGTAALASFRSFANRLVDYDVFDKSTDAFVATEAMIEVSDDNFESVFEQFLIAFRRVH